MPYTSRSDLPDSVKDNLPEHAQDIYRKAYNSAWGQYDKPSERREAPRGEETAHKVAWSAVEKEYEKGPTASGTASDVARRAPPRGEAPVRSSDATRLTAARPTVCSSASGSERRPYDGTAVGAAVTGGPALPAGRADRRPLPPADGTGVQLLTRRHGLRACLRYAQHSIVLSLLAALLSACAPAATRSAATVPARQGELTVFAAASLTEAFTDIGASFEGANPGVTVSFNFAGSSALRTQLSQGAQADLFASADEPNMRRGAGRWRHRRGATDLCPQHTGDSHAGALRPRHSQRLRTWPTPASGW